MTVYWLCAYKYLKCSFKIPQEVETQILQPDTPIGLKITNVFVFVLIQISAACKVWQIYNDETQKDIFFDIPFTMSFIAISFGCSVALYKIRSFLKAKGLAHKTDLCKIAFQVTIFTCFSIELIVHFIIVKFENDSNNFKFEYFFRGSLDLADLGFLWILYQLGTK